jgi:hypothetical protein
MVILLVLLINLFQTEIPLKPAEEFECKLNLSFKVRSTDNQPTVDYTETVTERAKRFSSTPLPYLKLKLKFIKLSADEFRMQATGGDTFVRNKKIVAGEEVELDLGYTDDIKDGILPRDYVVILQTKDRKPVSKVTISFTKEGDYLLNGVKRGRI